MARAGWVARTNRTATVGLGHSEPLALRAPSCERAGPGRAREGSGPAPLSAAGGHPLAARPTRGARRQWPAQPTWPCKGRRPGPPATLLAFPGLYGPPQSRGAQHSGCFPFAVPLFSSLHCRPPAWWSRPGRPPWCPPLPRPRRRLPAPSFADV